jgi:hypothetical protein
MRSRRGPLVGNISAERKIIRCNISTGAALQISKTMHFEISLRLLAPRAEKLTHRRNKF